jgi:hypothetical protein
MAVFKNGLFINYNGEIINPVSNIAASVAANNFFQSAGITNQQQRYAIYNLVSDLQTYNIWDKMKAVYPFVGQPGVSSSFELNLKDVNTFRGTFNGGWNFVSTGVTPTNGYLDTGLNVNTELSGDNSHLTVYSRGLSTGGGDKYLIGAYASSNDSFYAIDTFGGSGYLGSLGSLSIANNASITNSLGLIGIKKETNNDQKSFRNSTILQTKTQTSTNKPNLNIYIGALNLNSNAFGYAIQEIAFASIGDGLTDTEAANLYTAVQRFQTTLGRQV